jgi:hypothetical protein
MTPKEKAKELVDKYLNADFNCKDCDMPFCDMKCVRLHNYEAKQCALITCNEVLGYMGADRGTEFWQKVKQEIKKL